MVYVPPGDYLVHRSAASIAERERLRSGLLLLPRSRLNLIPSTSAAFF